MLVLRRHIGESIVINNTITIMVVDIKDNQVRLGIEAPREIPVNRKEIQDRIKEEDENVK